MKCKKNGNVKILDIPMVIVKISIFNVANFNSSMSTTGLSGPFLLYKITSHHTTKTIQYGATGHFSHYFQK